MDELEVDAGVADSQLGEDAREAREAARTAVQAAEALLGPDRDHSNRSSKTQCAFSCKQL